MGLEPVLDLDPAFGEARLDKGIGLVGDLEALPSQVDRHHAQVDLVLDMILEGVRREIELPLGEEGVFGIVAEAQARLRPAGEGVKAARLMEFVILIPCPCAQRLNAQRIVDAAEHADPVHVIFGRANRHGHAVGAGRIGRPPQAHAAIIVIIALDAERRGLADRGRQANRAQPVLAQARRVIIGVVGAGDVAGIDLSARDRCAAIIVQAVGEWRSAAVADPIDVVEAVGIIDRARIVGERVVPVPSQAADHVHRHVLIVLLAPVRIAQPPIDGRVAGRDHDLRIAHMLVLRPLALPLVGRAITIGDIAADAIARAQRQPGEGAPGFVAAIGQVALASERSAAQIFGRVGGKCLDRTTKIAGRLGAKRTRPLTDAHAADILAADRTGDVQAVMVAIAHVAQRNAVEGESQLVLVEAADGDALRPFIIAERVGGLEIDAWQLLDCLERIGARRQRDDVLVRDFLHLARFATAKDDDFPAVRRRGCCGQGVLRESRRRRQESRCKQESVKWPHGDSPPGHRSGRRVARGLYRRHVARW